jgi:hypothetical protein
LGIGNLYLKNDKDEQILLVRNVKNFYVCRYLYYIDENDDLYVRLLPGRFLDLCSLFDVYVRQRNEITTEPIKIFSKVKDITFDRVYFNILYLSGTVEIYSVTDDIKLIGEVENIRNLYDVNLLRKLLYYGFSTYEDVKYFNRYFIVLLQHDKIIINVNSSLSIRRFIDFDKSIRKIKYSRETKKIFIWFEDNTYSIHDTVTKTTEKLYTDIDIDDINESFDIILTKENVLLWNRNKIINNSIRYDETKVILYQVLKHENFDLEFLHLRPGKSYPEFLYLKLE